MDGFPAQFILLYVLYLGHSSNLIYPTHGDEYVEWQGSIRVDTNRE